MTVGTLAVKAAILGTIYWNLRQAAYVMLDIRAQPQSCWFFR